ncbi:MAG: peroxiredoxin family protein [Acidobacteriota bacterium]|nr:peroxiredoxin family protein [Acidobacteriota bacterium]
MLEIDENVALFAISIDDAEKSKMMMQKVAKDGKGEIKYPLLSDPMHKTIDDYGLLDTRYIGKGVEGIPQTAIYILDKNRKIVWVNVSPDYSNRPNMETLRMEIDKFKKKSEMNKMQINVKKN